MSRIAPNLWLAAALFALSGTAAQAQDSPSSDASGDAAGKAQQAIDKAKQVYGPADPDRECAEKKDDSDGQIVVCGQQDNSQFRVKSTAELDPNSREALDDGQPHAPDVSGDYIFKGPATVGGLCGIGLNKCPPPPAIFIDVTKLPEAPPGSDADKIAKGEAPG